MKGKGGGEAVEAGDDLGERQFHNMVIVYLSVPTLCRLLWAP